MAGRTGGWKWRTFSFRLAISSNVLGMGYLTAELYDKLSLREVAVKAIATLPLRTDRYVGQHAMAAEPVRPTRPYGLTNLGPKLIKYSYANVPSIFISILLTALCPPP